MVPVRSRRLLLAVAAGVTLYAAATLWVAWRWYQEQATLHRQQVAGTLSAIAELKVSELDSWLRERRADGRYYVDNRMIQSLAGAVLGAGGNAVAEAALGDAVRRMQENHGYHWIGFFDTTGRRRVVEPALAADDGHMRAAVLDAIAIGALRVLDVHTSADGVPHMAIIAPLVSGPPPANPYGAMVLQIDVTRALTPIITRWPIPSTTSATVLLRREGDDVVYLNALMGLGPAGMAPRQPVSRTDLPGVQAVVSGRRVIEATTADGLPVVAASMAVPESSWMLLASQSRDEAMGPLRDRATVAISVVALLLGAGVTVSAVLWRRQASRQASSQAKLVETLTAMAQVVDASPAVLFRWSPDGQRVLWVSANVSRWGYSVERLLANDPPVISLVHPDDRDRVQAETGRYLMSGASEIAQEYRVLRPDGGIIWVDDRSRVVRDGTGTPVRIDGILTDVTERKELQAQFVQAQKMETVGRLAGGVAHDFNNLLTVINGYAEFAMSEVAEDHPVHSMLSEVRDSGQRAANLTRQLLAFSRRQVVQPVSLNLNTSTEQLRKMLQRLIGEDIQLSFDLEPEVWTVRADAGQIEQVIMNLAVNARDAMPDGGALVITTRNVEEGGDRRVMLAVTDTGCGMDEQVQARVFEPFFTTKRVGEGTGLGLSTVYGIVTQAGGRLELSSTVGKGTTFRIFLPAESGAAPVGEGAVASTSVVRGHETILVVEDEDALRRIARRFLESAGYRVVTAATGEAALETLRQVEGRIDLLLTDVVMPGMNGHDLAERVRQSYPGLKVLFVSGYLHEAFPDRARLGPEVHFLAKPYTPSSLTQRVRDVLDRP